MTVKLLSDWGPQPAGTLFTGTTATETAMVATGVATTSLTGGIAWVPNIGSPGSTPIFLGRKSAAEIAAINASIAAGTANYPVGSTVVNTDTGVAWKLAGLGTAGAFAVDGGGNSSPTAPVQVGGSRPLASTDNGLVLECTATANLTVTAGLPAGFRCVVIPFGTTSVAFTGTTGNGAGTTITRAAASNAVFGITQRGSAANSYVVDGV